MSLLAKKYHPEFIISGLGILIVVILIWVPFGLKTTVITDGWGNFRFVGVNGFAEYFKTGNGRPLVYLPWNLAYAINSHSFIGVGLVLAALFWGKAIVFYAILRKSRLVAPALGFLMAILFMLYPADQGHFLMAALGRHAAMFFYLLAVLLLILASQSSSPMHFIGLLFGMLLAEGASALTSEQGYPLMLFTPAVLLICRERSNRKKYTLTVAWYAVLIFSIINFLAAQKNYQTRIFQNAQVNDKFGFLKDTILSNLLAYRRIFGDGWLKAFNALLNPQGSYVLYGFAILLIVGCIIYLLSRLAREDDSETIFPGPRHIGIWFFAGLAIIGLGFSPYSITSYRFDTDFRVFYYSEAGGALVTGLIYFWVSQRLPAHWKTSARILIWGATIFLISYNSLAQHAQYVARSLVQQKVLINIVEQAPSVKPDTVIVLLPDNNIEAISTETTEDIARFTAMWPFRSNTHSTHAVSWAYDERVSAILCEDLLSCQPHIKLENSILFRYIEGGGAIMLDEIPDEYQNKIKAGDYHPYNRIRSYVPFPVRLQKAFNYMPLPSRIAPRNWNSEGQTLNDRRVCDVSHSGDCSLLFFGDGKMTTFSHQIENVGITNNHFVLSYWSKAEISTKKAVPFAALRVYYNDGSEEDFIVSGQLSNTWSLQQSTFEIGKPYFRLTIQLHPNIKSGLIWLDDVSLLKDNSNIFIINASFEK